MERREEKRSGERKRKERRWRGGKERRGVKRGTKKKKGRNERWVCSVPQTDTSLLSAAQSNHMPRGHNGKEGRKMRCKCRRGGVD